MRTVRELREMYRDLYGEPPPSSFKAADLQAAIGRAYSDENTLEQIPVMLAHRIDELGEEEQERVLSSDRWVAMEKLNGVMMRLHLGPWGARLDGRKRSDVTCLFIERTDNFPHIKSLYIPELDGTVMVGELVFDAAESIQSGDKQIESSLFMTIAIVSPKPDRAKAVQDQYGTPTLRIFDLIKLKHVLLNRTPFEKRYKALQKIWERFPVLGEHGVHLLPIVRDNKKAFYEQVVARDGEGIMLRHLDHPYEPGRRVWHMLKMKRYYTYDCFITGSEKALPGKKYDGLVGSLEISAYDEEGREIVVGHVNPGTDVVRRRISLPDGSLNPKMLGVVVEVKAMGWTPKLLLYHTSLIRYRHDKNASDCVIDMRKIKAKFVRWRSGWL